jgi:hypothetical protein
MEVFVNKETEKQADFFFCRSVRLCPSDLCCISADGSLSPSTTSAAGMNAGQLVFG